jgi:hypothetical protein
LDAAEANRGLIHGHVAKNPGVIATGLEEMNNPEFLSSIHVKLRNAMQESKRFFPKKDSRVKVWFPARDSVVLRPFRPCFSGR